MTVERWTERPGTLDTPCLIWNGATSGHYGWHSGSRTHAHRAVWQEQRGELPEGAHLHHACREPLCVNVEHLRVLSPGEHRREHGMDARRPSRLDAQAVKDIREGSDTLAMVAARYSISRSYASLVRRGLAPDSHRLDVPLEPWARGRPKPPRFTGRLLPADVAFIRERRDLSLAALAEMFGMSRVYMNEVRQGRAPKD
jgi:hypothetical protein